MGTLPSIFDTCVPREEILSGGLSLDLFAAKLRQVVEGSAPAVYQDPKLFFGNTYPTSGLRVLIAEVFGRLVGVSVGAPVIRLETSFGGGKTHDEIALWHICRNGRAIEGLERFVDDLNAIPAQPIAVAAVDGRDLDPVNGVYHPDGVTTYTLWGEIAYQIGGVAGYQLLRGSDEQKISPGTSVLERLLKGKPTVIILDEVARYLRAAKAVGVMDSTLAEQVVAFLFSLMDLAAASNHLVFVYSLASARDTFADETTELHELIQCSARQERVLAPSSDRDIYNIVKQRLFQSVSTAAAQKASKEYLSAFRASHLLLPEGCKDAQYIQEIEASYPFHPELFSLLTKKIASIQEFQRTRGALRLFALVIRYLWEERSDFIPMIHPHHVPVGVDQNVTLELTSKLNRPQMDLPIKADIHNVDGKEAHAQIQDKEWKAAAKPPFSSWVGRTIFLHSLTQGISSGVRRSELYLSLLTPGLEIGFVDKALERLVNVAWYLEDDPISSRSRFKEEPSINKIIAEEKEQVGIAQAKDDLRARRDTIFATKLFTLVAAPEGPGDVDDCADSIALCVVDFDEAKINDSTDPPPVLIEQIFSNTGESGKFRTFRNRLLFLLANRHDLDRAIENAREFRAIKNILASQNRLDDLSDSQQSALKEREGTKDLDVRVSLTNAYRHLFYPVNDPVKAPKGLMHYVLPAQDSSDIKGKNNQQEVILKALKDCQKIRQEDALPYAPAYLLQKVWPAGLDHWTTKALKEAFFKDISLNVHLDAEVSKLRDSIRKGLQDGQWDLKVGEKVYIKTDDGNITLPDSIEFSDRMVLYRRGILKPPAPKLVELSAQLMSSNDLAKPVRVRWRAQGALSVTLFQNGTQVSGELLPSDEKEISIEKSTEFRLVADYGGGEKEEKRTLVTISSGSGAYPSGSGSKGQTANDEPGLFEVKPEVIESDGSLTKTFTEIQDLCTDYKVQGLHGLEISVDQVMDYRKLTTALSLLTRFTFEIDQTATIQAGNQFVRLIYQGDRKGFSSFMTPINSLLNTEGVQAEVKLKLVFRFDPPVVPKGSEIATIQQALGRNPVDRLLVLARVVY